MWDSGSIPAYYNFFVIKLTVVCIEDFWSELKRTSRVVCDCVQCWDCFRTWLDTRSLFADSCRISFNSSHVTHRGGFHCIQKCDDDNGHYVIFSDKIIIKLSLYKDIPHVLNITNKFIKTRGQYSRARAVSSTSNCCEDHERYLW
jgi:hypothetical protein